MLALSLIAVVSGKPTFGDLFGGKKGGGGGGSGGWSSGGGAQKLVFDHP